MKQTPILCIRTLFVLAIIMLTSNISHAQNNINLANDTLSEAVAKSGRDMFFHDIADSRPTARNRDLLTKQIMLSVSKLKDIIDRCTANGITDVAVFFMTIRASDVPHFQTHNPGMTAAALMGKQVLVIRVPRSIFASPAGSKNNLSGNPLMLSLLASGFVPLADQPFGTGDLYLSFGSICPPPTSCD